jgi:hypothetical protein
MSTAHTDGHDYTCPHCRKSLRVIPAPEAVSRPASYPREPQQRRPDGSLAPMPMTVERAAAFNVPIGKHKGMTIAEIARKDHGWLRWYAANGTEGSVKRAVVHFLENSDA